MKYKTVEEYWLSKFASPLAYSLACQKTRLQFPCFACLGKGKMKILFGDPITCLTCNGLKSFSYTQAKNVMDNAIAFHKQAKANLKEQAEIRKDLRSRFCEAELEWIERYEL